MRYEKGRKDASRQRILEVAAERFRCDGVAATGLAKIMTDAGLTNGAFYPHFQSKAELVRESVATALDKQSERLDELVAAGGLEAAFAAYLSPAHRDDPGHGCALAALLPELAREPAETRMFYADRILETARKLSEVLPSEAQDKEGTSIAIYAMLIGAIQLSRLTEGTALSARILAAGAEAVRMLTQPRHDEGAP
jgi:TetR/AcrR family transcriptional repressor of nem operon